MMVKKEIEFVIDESNTLPIDVKNGEGPTCLEETKDLEKKLVIVESRQKKPELYKKVGIKRKNFNFLKDNGGIFMNSNLFHLGHQITFYIEKDGSITISDFPFS